jgi:DNA-binding MarR family transcriptional regulator
MDLHGAPEQLRDFERLCEMYLRCVHQRLGNEDFTAMEMRVIQLLGMPPGVGSGAHLARCLAIDQGYMCRILRKLSDWELVTARSSPTDARAREWQLTPQGMGFAGSIEREFRERAKVRVLYGQENDRRRLTAAMRIVADHLLRPEIYRF